MNSGRGGDLQSVIQKSFVKWTTTYVVGWAACQLVFVAVITLALKLSVQSMILPYVLLAGCGYVGGCLIYWATQFRQASRSGPTRFAVAIFFFLTLYMGVLIFSTYKLNLISLASAVHDYAPYVLPGAALTSTVVYIMAQRRQSKNDR